MPCGSSARAHTVGVFDRLKGGLVSRGVLRIASLTGILTVVVLAAGVAPTAASTPPTTWQSVPNSWGQSPTFVVVGDGFATDNTDWVVGTVTTSGGLTKPAVQRCAASCTLKRLPVGTAQSARANSVSGTADDDIWAVGSVANAGVNDATAWHWNGQGWRRFDTVAGDVDLTNIVSVSRTESWALGHEVLEDTSTTVVIHRVGSTWTEVSPLGMPVFPGACAEWFANSFRDIAVVDGRLAIVGLCSGSPVILKQRDSAALSWVNIGAGLPAGNNYRIAATVSRHLWVMGSEPDGTTSIERRGGGQWHQVSTIGLDPAALIVDLAGGLAGKVVAVGWTGGSPTTAVASFTWNGAEWLSIGPAFGPNTGLVAVSIAPGGHTVAAGFDRSKPAPQSGLILDQVGSDRTSTRLAPTSSL
jgi:hypothetical protein